MKQVAQNYKTGKILIKDVIAPMLKEGGVLVRSHFSVVSSGTEGMKVKEGKLSYLGKARARPDQLKKVLNTVKQQGVVSTYQKVMNKLDSSTPLGYSLSGTVIAVGTGAEEFHVGQCVACAGAGYANHAEINFVPKNLVVPVPDGVHMKHAAFATVGAIALQGFRQANVQLGESACVIGLGLIGLLLTQILRASGAKVCGVDIVESRCQLAEHLGASMAVLAGDPALDNAISRLSGGFGVDHVFIAAGGSSNSATELAVRVARDRARIVDIGKTKLDLPWNDYYMKELDLRFSRSYGPGRYDPIYEEKGIDYPIGYVRWTERRNLTAFLELVAESRVKIDPIISEIYPFSEAEVVYQKLAQPGNDVLGVVFDYGNVETDVVAPKLFPIPTIKNKISNSLQIGVIGAGNYASTMLFPHLVRNKNVKLISVATTTSLSAQNAQRKFGFQTATTDYREILDCDAIDAVIIATRHASHAHIVSEALLSGKATYVEKPLAITFKDLELVQTAVIESGNSRLMVGFNRRFSNIVNKLSKQFRGKQLPIVAHYRVHAGRLDSGSWYLDKAEGSRFIGEAGHFLDVLSYIIDSRPASVSAIALRPSSITPDDLENVAAIVRYENGSVGNLLYLTQGDAKVPKEYLEVFGGGMTAQLHNFESIVFFGNNTRKQIKSLRVEKGQSNEIMEFVEAVRNGNQMPISVESLFDTTLTTLAISESLRSGKEVQINSLFASSSHS